MKDIIEGMKIDGHYPDGIGQDIDSCIFYHGTGMDGKNIFEKQGYLGFEYYDGIGIWITSDLHHACGFGAYIYRIGCVGLDELLMDWMHPDDGIYYKGKIAFNYVVCLNDHPNDPDYLKMCRHQLDYTP